MSTGYTGHTGPTGNTGPAGPLVTGIILTSQHNLAPGATATHHVQTDNLSHITAGTYLLISDSTPTGAYYLVTNVILTEVTLQNISSVTCSWSAGSAFTITGPRGDLGATGNTGDTGATGATGATGLPGPLVTGFFLNSENGIPPGGTGLHSVTGANLQYLTPGTNIVVTDSSPNGAYLMVTGITGGVTGADITIQNISAGTAYWTRNSLFTLAGPVGFGYTGATGATGVTGATGRTGAPGATGATGITGPPGPLVSGLIIDGATLAPGGTTTCRINTSHGNFISSGVIIVVTNYSNLIDDAYLLVTDLTGGVASLENISTETVSWAPNSYFALTGPRGATGSRGATGVAGVAGPLITGTLTTNQPGPTGLAPGATAEYTFTSTALDYITDGLFVSVSDTGSRTGYYLITNVSLGGVGGIDKITLRNMSVSDPGIWGNNAKFTVVGPPGMTGATGATGGGITGDTGRTGATGVTGPRGHTGSPGSLVVGQISGEVAGLMPGFSHPYIVTSSYTQYISEGSFILINDDNNKTGYYLVVSRSGNSVIIRNMSDAEAFWADNSYFTLVGPQGIKGDTGVPGPLVTGMMKSPCEKLLPGQVGEFLMFVANNDSEYVSPGTNITINDVHTLSAYYEVVSIRYPGGSNYNTVMLKNLSETEGSWSVNAPFTLVGPKGVQGVQGIPGNQGNQGLKGDKGDTGPMGERGLQGVIGPSGNPGNQGLKGDKGDTGPIGERGLQGVTGPSGLMGPTGSRGATGISGGIINGLMMRGEVNLPKGMTGSYEVSTDYFQYLTTGLYISIHDVTDDLSCYYQIIDTSFASPYNKIIIKNIGDGVGSWSSNAHFVALGPRGLDGTMGLVGPMGPMGPMGPTGASVTPIDSATAFYNAYYNQMFNQLYNQFVTTFAPTGTVGYANTFSLFDSPIVGSTSRVPSFVKLSGTDTGDFRILNTGELSVINPGKWRFLAQYQLVFIGGESEEVAFIDGLFSLNGQKIVYSDATSSVSKKCPKNVLAIEAILEVKAGDKVGIMVASTNTRVGICRAYNNTGLTDESGNQTNNTDVEAPSVILTASKIWL